MARIKPLWLHLSTLAERLRRASSLAIASDYDGTLTPIVPHPDRAKLPERTHRALGRIARLEATRLAILSGRSLPDLARCVNLPGVFLAGAAGLETRDEHGHREVHLGRGEEVPLPLREELEEWVRRFPGSWLEDKKLSFALHYRRLSPRDHAAFGAGVRRRMRNYMGRAELVHGKRVYEVMPAVPRDKGSALDRWLGGQQPGAALFYFGDDANDEPAHLRVRRRNGISVAVGRDDSRAEYVVTTTDEVVWFLEWLEREWAALRRSAAALREREGVAPA